MSGHPIRSGAVFIHRYVGLMMGAFLILEGVTGSVLSFRAPLEEWATPWLFAAPRPGVAPLALSALAARAQAQEPKIRPGYFSIEDRQVVMAVLPRTNPASGKPYAVDFDHMYLDPWTGRELGHRRWGDIGEGPVNLIPFLYKLHMNIAAGDIGQLLLGVVATAWTIDCLLAVFLTLPVSRARFFERWRTAWGVKHPSSAFRLNFDLHRAGGLWLWPLLFVLAWSSVMLTLPQPVFEPVMGALFDYRSDSSVFQAMNRSRHANPAPKLTWTQAQAAGEHAMAAEARRRGFRIERPYGMGYIADWGVYTYAVVSDVNVEAHAWNTSLWLDGDSGEVVDGDFTQSKRMGNLLAVWLRALHFADVGDSLVYRMIVFIVGLAIAGLSGTGIYIWWRKRSARRHGRQRPAAFWPLATTARKPQKELS